LARVEDTIEDTKVTRGLSTADMKQADILKAHGCWAGPSVGGGRIFIRNTAGHVLCLDTRKP
jgi:hypothetical protein